MLLLALWIQGSIWKMEPKTEKKKHFHEGPSVILSSNVAVQGQIDKINIKLGEGPNLNTSSTESSMPFAQRVSATDIVDEVPCLVGWTVRI